MLVLSTALVLMGAAAMRAAPASTSTVGGCSTDLDCSLNGVCTAGECACDKPWSGDACQTLTFATTPALAKSLYNISDPRNTWNGPIVTGSDGKFHMYVPIYNKGSLGGPPSMLHGLATSVTGPWDWTSLPQMPTAGENPAAVVFKNESGGTVYSIWIGGKIRISDSPYGPFIEPDGYRYPGGNPAPLFHNGAFYMTNQGTGAIYTSPRLGAPWTTFATLNHSALPDPTYYHVEDPFMWIDKRGNWHIINHAYRNDEYERCGSSVVSAHWYSADGKAWTWASQPYSHTVQYDDGTSHTYTTLERPNLHFDASGQLTHLNVAADLVTGDEGCASRTKHAHFGHTPCDNCKWDDHAGTIIIALDV
mmetsp:Transcript_17727/g.46280  ORF Transcript_17727/g.46280 Transcript_17727/m.46280 type:complete len:363 (-) Transcript_17727:1552-2640(-)